MVGRRISSRPEILELLFWTGIFEILAKTPLSTLFLGSQKVVKVCGEKHGMVKGQFHHE